MDNPQIFLASRSPRRRTLIDQIGLRYQTIDIALDEQVKPGESPTAYVTRLAVEKAKLGYEKIGGGQVPVLGADT